MWGCKHATAKYVIIGSSESVSFVRRLTITGTKFRALLFSPQQKRQILIKIQTPDSKVHGANTGPIWDRQDPGGSHVGPMNFVIWDVVFWEVVTENVVCNMAAILSGHQYVKTWSCEYGCNIFFKANNYTILRRVNHEYTLRQKVSLTLGMHVWQQCI